MLGSNYLAMAMMDNVVSADREIIKFEDASKKTAHEIVTLNMPLDKLFRKKFGFDVADWDRQMNNM
jgi:hypothetical protein